MSTATTTTVPTTTAAFTLPTPGSLPVTYVESDPAQCNEAKIAHLLGLFGIVGTGIYYLVKKDTAGRFVRDQMSEAFNFHLLVFCAAIAISIVGAVATAIAWVLGLVMSLASFALMIAAIWLSITNGLKAGKGEVARYPARWSVLK